MYYKWLQWQEDAALEAQIFKYLNKRKEKRIEIYHHQHKLFEMECITSRIRADMFRAMQEYEDLDLEMAMFDGRLSFVRMETTKKREVKIAKEIKNMSLDERQKLFKELKALNNNLN